MSEAARVLTWAALLSKWTEFARASVALPREGEGARLRRAVPALIGLQAVTHALAELDFLPREEQAVGLDRAAVLIERYEGELSVIWEGHVPGDVGELAADARQALKLAQPLP